MPLLLIYAHLGDAKVWCYMFICPKPGTLGACLGEKRPENGPNVGQKTKIDLNCSYGQKQALWAHVWAENGPKTAETRPDSD